MKINNIIISFAFLVMLAIPAAGFDAEQVINSYYKTFQSEDLNKYLSTQYLDNLNQSELEQKESFIKKLFEIYDVDSFRISNLTTIKVSDDVYLLEYNLNSTVSSNKKKKSYSLNYIAIIYKNKIYSVTPKALFDFNSDALIKLYNLEGNDLLTLNNINQSLNEDENKTCKINQVILDNIGNLNLNLSDYPLVKKIIGTNKYIKLQIAGVNKSYFFQISNIKILSLPKSEAIKLDYIIKVDSCTINNIVSYNSLIEEYKKGKIEIKGGNTISKLKVLFGKFLFKIYSLFSCDNVLISKRNKICSRKAQ